MLFNKQELDLSKLSKMGGNIQILNKRKVNNEILADLKINQKSLKSTTLKPEDVPLQIDEIPILSIAASYAKGTSVFSGLKELTVKESNRLALIHQNLKNMGMKVRLKNLTYISWRY